MFNDDFYPTPPSVVKTMMSVVDFNVVRTVLDPSAGKGDIIKEVAKAYTPDRWTTTRLKFLAIEVEQELQQILLNLTYPVQDPYDSSKTVDISVPVDLVDSDFLEYPGGDHFDLIMMNPPFSNGEDHLLKAIDLLYNGQLVCLLNAETINNPYSNKRRLLLQKLEEVGARVDMLGPVFSDAERKTDVEVAMVYLRKRADVFDDPFKGASDDVEAQEVFLEESTDVAPKDDITARIALYEATKNDGIEVIRKYYSRFSRVGKYIEFTGESRGISETVGRFVDSLRRDYWLSLMDIPEITDKLTSEKRKEYRAMLDRRSKMEFNQRNIYAVITALHDSYGKVIEAAILDMFDVMSRQFSWLDETSKNTLHFNGWKTNKSWKVNSKVILPNYQWINWNGKWNVPYERAEFLRDIDRVMNYFDGGRRGYHSIVEALESAFASGKSRNIESEYFLISCFKKGTLHLTFKNEGILRRFNLFCCREKNWLPPAYGMKSYSDMTKEEQEVVKSFDGSAANYIQLPSNKEMLKLAA